MAFPLVYIPCKRQLNKHSLLMEQAGTRVDPEHVIDITRNNEASSSSSSPSVHDRRIYDDSDLLQHGDRPSSSTRTSILQLALPSNASNSRTSSLGRRGNNHNRRRRSPLNSGLWISVELVLTVAQIVASAVVLALSRHEHPHTPLFGWIVGYACGCVVTLPLLCWRYLHRNEASDQESSQSRQNSSGGSSHSVGRVFSRYASQTFDGDDHAPTSSAGSPGVQSVGMQNARLKAIIEYAKMAVDCFFAVWFVVGNVWIFGGHTTASDAPNMYRLCVVFLAFSCVGYAMPFILCATICCCLPCIISVLGFREDLNQTRGATAESINALPTYKFKLKKGKNIGNNGGNEGGVVAAGTEKEQVISGEDATCCICLANYANNDELRELPCSHLFHKECVDKWLKINANCPLCKSEVGESILSSLASATANLRPS